MNEWIHPQQEEGNEDISYSQRHHSRAIEWGQISRGIFDQELRFKSHLQYIVKKLTNAAMALSSIAKSTWEAPYMHVRQFFQAVVAPRTDYAVIVWHRSKKIEVYQAWCRFGNWQRSRDSPWKSSSDATEPRPLWQWRWSLVYNLH